MHHHYFYLFPIQGTAKGHVVLTDQSGNELMCVDLDIKI